MCVNECFIGVWDYVSVLKLYFSLSIFAYLEPLLQRQSLDTNTQAVHGTRPNPSPNQSGAEHWREERRKRWRNRKDGRS